MGKKLEMKKNYLLKVAIDFGSTNTVMAWRMYEKDNNGNPRVSEKLNSVNNIIKIPSIMIFADENLGNEAVKYDLFGDDAVAAVEHANTAPVVCDNFKQLLYVNKDGSPGYQRGVELCIKFFEHLRSVYRTKIINPLPPQVLSDMEVILYISTPVRADFYHHSKMLEIAVNAGFTETNGITEIDNTLDEATCIVKYAFETIADKSNKAFTKAGSEKGALLLFVDAGGSTLDSCIIRLQIKEDGSILMDPISKWPKSPDVKYPLGGYLIDKAIRDYMISNGFANEEFTMNKWNHGNGKYLFKKFKEENNQTVESGEISRLGNLRYVCYDDEEEIAPKYKYSKSHKKINAEIYEKEICKEFINNLKLSFKELFESQRSTQYGKVTPADIDGVFLTGAGSNLYFIPKVLLEDFDEKTPGFIKVQRDRELLFSDWKDPSVCCALGALTDDENINMPNYAKDKYYLYLQIYSHCNTIGEELKNGNIRLSPTSSTIKIRDTMYSCPCIANLRFKISDLHQILPIVSEFEEKSTYNDSLNLDYMTIQAEVKKHKSTGTLETIGKTYTYTTKRTFSDRLLYYLRLTAFTASSIIPNVGLKVIDGVTKMFGGKGKLSEEYIKTIDDLIFPDREVNVNVKAKVTMGYNTISIETKLEGDYFNDGENTISIKI